MCDSAVHVRAGRVLFAKNSDRDPNEAQILEWHPRRSHAPGSSLRCTWIGIPQVRETCALLISRPFWMWGAEMGANEHGVVIGNEAVFTDQPLEDTGLTGMDLLRLALERAESAERAVEVLTDLLEVHGQGGGCGHENRLFSYHNSFLVADARGAFVVETAGRRWVAERVARARSISNGLTIEPFASRHADRLRSRIAACDARRGRSEALVRRAEGPADMMALLRDHGPGCETPRYSFSNGALGAPCVHAGGLLVTTQTTSSWVADLRPEGALHWVTAAAAPCTGLFKPVRVGEPVDLGPAPDDRADEVSPWWRHERLHRRVARDPATLLPLYCGERDAVERRWIASPPESAKAFAEAEQLVAGWTRRVAAAGGRDAERSRRAGLELH
jgi:dipeptidase